MTKDIEMIQSQRCAIVVVCGSRDKPEWITHLLMETGDLSDHQSHGATIVALDHSRQDICTLTQIQQIADQNFANCKVGKIWLAVVNGRRDILEPNGRLTPISGITPELICLYSTEQRPLIKT
ncbi:MAG: hypothetical protein WCI57_00225 [Candidatus Berkelbacteria bacterium]